MAVLSFNSFNIAIKKPRFIWQHLKGKKCYWSFVLNRLFCKRLPTSFVLINMKCMRALKRLQFCFVPVMTVSVLSRLISGLHIPSREYEIRSSLSQSGLSLNSILLEGSSVACPGLGDHVDLTDSRRGTFVGCHMQSASGRFAEKLDKARYLVDIYWVFVATQVQASISYSKYPDMLSVIKTNSSHSQVSCASFSEAQTSMAYKLYKEL